MNESNDSVPISSSDPSKLRVYTKLSHLLVGTKLSLARFFDALRPWPPTSPRGRRTEPAARTGPPLLEAGCHRWAAGRGFGVERYAGWPPGRAVGSATATGACPNRRPVLADPRRPILWGRRPGLNRLPAAFQAVVAVSKLLMGEAEDRRPGRLPQKSTYPFAVLTLHPGWSTWTLTLCQAPSLLRLLG